MRVISQDGTTDFPYDNAWVSAYERCINGRIYARVQLCGYDDSVDVADYSTKEKAIKAMEMLRKAWINEAAEFEDGIYHRNIIFQFPQDDEIEV